MKTRRTFIAASAVAVSLASLRTALAQVGQEVEFLFVQSAKSMTFDKTTSKVTLVGVSPATVFSPTAPTASPET